MSEYYVEVGSTSCPHDLYSKLNHLRLQEGLPFELYEHRIGTSSLIRCVYSALKGKKEENRLAIRIYNYYFAKALAEIICREWEKVFVRKILKKEYSLSYTDIEKIIERSWSDLDNYESSYLSKTKKHVLIKSLLEFLDTHKQVNLEGFVNFRASLYKKELRRQIAIAVKDYAFAQENKKFIKMLKKFVARQEPLFSTMHLIIKRDGGILLLDEEKKDINKKDRFFPSQERAGKGYYDDLLISALLRCSPNNLIVHAAETSHIEMIEIIREVFENKISFCRGCPLCKGSD
ncbi:MAG: sporulation protein YtxC [Desulfitobacteriia bacterium]|jgi:putative sporulation protein YtxC